MSINGVITYESLTSLFSTLSGNVNTISGGLNNLTNYISTYISGDVILTSNNFNFSCFMVFKPQTAFTNNIAFQQFINQNFKIILCFI